MSNNIHEPNMDLLKSNDIYLFYEMMIHSLKTDNVTEGLNTSFKLLRSYLQSGHISLYKKNTDNKYIFKFSDSPMNNLIKSTSNIINETKFLSEVQNIFTIDLNLSDELKNVLLMHIKLDDVECILSIINYNKNDLDLLFWERLKETMKIIIKRAASYEKNLAAITTDLLTGLDNRNSYEICLQNLNEDDKNLIFGIFDLFRLKYINDNYGHPVGDEYIKKAAKILGNYWKKYNTFLDDDGKESHIKTGHCIYRIGGDEFALLTNVDSLQYANVKANLASLEASKIQLIDGEIIPTGINYGIVHHNAGDSIKQTFTRADIILNEDKKKMYTKYGLERRH